MSKADITMNLFYTSLFICLYDNQLHGKNDCETTQTYCLVMFTKYLVIRSVHLNLIYGDRVIVSNTSGLAILQPS